METVSRATKCLVETHGKNAARVAAQRALNAELGGSFEAAQVWRQIAACILDARKAELRELDDADLGSVAGGVRTYGPILN
jgi:hypothetical protein